MLRSGPANAYSSRRIVDINCHFVSRFLTAPWEFGQRRLWFYDFETGQIGAQSSRSLFATAGRNSEEVEERLNRLIETPIAQARRTLWGAGDDVSPALEWPLFRALALLLLLQPFRATDAPEGPQTLDEVLGRPEDYIDGLARAVGSRYRLMRITVSPHSPLYYPSDGWFPLTATPIGNGCAFGIAIPLNAVHAFVGVRSDVQPQQTEIWSLNGAGLVSNYSVGYRSRRVVIHPAAVDGLTQSQLIDAIRAAREGVARSIALCHDLTAVIRRMEAILPT